MFGPCWLLGLSLPASPQAAQILRVAIFSYWPALRSDGRIGQLWCVFPAGWIGQAIVGGGDEALGGSEEI